MRGVRVRRARPGERDAVLALWTALHREHEALDPRYRLADDAPLMWANDFQEWARDDQHAYLVAEEERGRLVGLITAHLLVPTPVYAPDLFAHVDDLYVVPEARGRGVGARLVEAVRDWARAQGASSLRAGVLALNPAGRAFWARMGAADFAVTVTLDG